MSKFAGRPVARGTQSFQTVAPTRTYEGGRGYTMDAESELFLLAATYIPGENTFYQAGNQRDSRFVDLVHQVTKNNPQFIAGDGQGRRGFASYLRNDLRMRSASVVMACEYIKAGGPGGRAVVNNVCQRPDEPAEVLGYWMSTYGRALPAAIKRGIADGVGRLYTEKNIIRYDGKRDAMRFADVIELVHPVARDDYQSKLFKYLLDNRHHPTSDQPEALFNLLSQDYAYLNLPEDVRRQNLDSIPSFWSWERLSGWLPGGMDAEAWESVLSQMGGMALLRNLRNFDAADISDTAVDQVIERITNEDIVIASRIWPHHVWLAHREAPSDNYKRALSKTFDLSTPNITKFPGGTLILADVSRSMQGYGYSEKSKLTPAEIATVLAAAMSKENDADVVAFATTSKEVVTPKGSSAWRTIESIAEVANSLGGGTNTHQAIVNHYNGHDRVIVLTDMQSADSDYEGRGIKCPIYTWDLRGYGTSNMEAGNNRYFLTGFNDSMLDVIGILERGRNSGWPF